jgi:hypothetical protein
MRVLRADVVMAMLAIHEDAANIAPSHGCDPSACDAYYRRCDTAPDRAALEIVRSALSEAGQRMSHLEHSPRRRPIILARGGWAIIG